MRRSPPRRCPALPLPLPLPLPRLRVANGGHGFRPALRYEGTDVGLLTALGAAGHGLALLARSAGTDVPGAVAVPIAHPWVVHRTELVYAGAPRRTAADFVDLPVPTASHSRPPVSLTRSWLVARRCAG